MGKEVAVEEKEREREGDMCAHGHIALTGRIRCHVI
jgi:hypothetical protein